MSIEDIAKPTNERTIRAIPALQVARNNAIRPVREAAYARVSTKTEEQLTSYKLQKKYYEEYISARSYQHVGVASFMRTGLSEVELEVLGWIR